MTRLSPHLRRGGEALSLQIDKGGPIAKPEPRRKKRPEREAIYVYGSLTGEGERCWLARFANCSCEGRMQKAHLIRMQTIRREVSREKAVLWSPQVWRPACYRHHVMLDQPKTLTIPREALPAETEQWAAEHGLTWWLERTYGPLPTLAGGS